MFQCCKSKHLLKISHLLEESILANRSPLLNNTLLIAKDPNIRNKPIVFSLFSLSNSLLNCWILVADFTNKISLSMRSLQKCGAWTAGEFAQKVETGSLCSAETFFCCMPHVLARNKHYLVLLKSPEVESVSWLNLIKRAGKNLSKKNKSLWWSGQSSLCHEPLLEGWGWYK